jgi:hypothetical protein
MKKTVILTVVLALAVNSFSQKKEIEKKRTHYSRTVVNEDESITTEIQLSPMHYTDQYGKMHPIDCTIQPSNTGYDYQVTTGLYHAYFKQNPTDDFPVVFESRGGIPLRFGLKSLVYFDEASKQYVVIENAKSGSPLVSGNSITYPDMFHYTDVKYYYKTTKLEEHIIFNQLARDNLPIPETVGLVSSNTFVMFLSQIELEKSLPAFIRQERVQTKRVLESKRPILFKNIQGETKFYMPPDYAYYVQKRQSAGPDSIPSQEISVCMKRRIFRENDSYYMLSGVSYDWLKQQGAGTIVFDPQVEINFQPSSSVGKEAWICSSPSYQDRNSGAEQRLQVENSPNIWSTLIEFSELQEYIGGDVTVSDASLSLYCSSTYNNPPPFDVYRLTHSWREGIASEWDGVANSDSIDGVTWNERWWGKDWDSSGGDYDSTPVDSNLVATADAWVDIDVTDVVQDWLDGTYENYGLIFINQSGSGYVRLRSADYSNSDRHPKLSVTYETSSPITTYYIRDASGQVIATYER